MFGVFAALAYDAANIANKQSSQANQLALLNFCMVQVRGWLYSVDESLADE